MGIFDIFNKDSIYNVPEKYNSFPLYKGKLKEGPIETLGDSYDRLTLYFSGKPNQEFINALLTAGFRQATPVRYDKDNTYVIVEESNSKTKIAYHIKR